MVENTDLPIGYSKLKSGTYRRRFSVNGIRYSDTDKDLEVLKGRTEETIVKIKMCMPCNPNGLTVSSFYALWVENFLVDSLRSTTINKYDSIFHMHIKPRLGGAKLDDISVFDVQSFYKILQSKGLKMQYVADIMITLNSIFKAAKSSNLISNNPVDIIRLERGKSQKKAANKAMTDEEVVKFLEIIRESKYYDIAVLLLLTGLRGGEGLALRECDLENKKISIKRTLIRGYSELHDDICFGIHDPKTASGIREIVCTKNVQKIIDKRISYRNTMRKQFGSSWGKCNVVTGNKITTEKDITISDFIFLDNKGNPINHTTINTDFRYRILKYNAKTKGNVKVVALHALRSTFLTKAYNCNIRPEVLQKIAGHGSYSVTADFYLAVKQSLQQEAFESIADAYGLVDTDWTQTHGQNTESL